MTNLISNFFKKSYFLLFAFLLFNGSSALANGEWSVQNSEIKAGSWNEIVFTYYVGSEGLQVGDSLVLYSCLPTTDADHLSCNSYVSSWTKWQLSNSQAEGFTTAFTSRENSYVSLSIQTILDQKRLKIVVQGSPLFEGDTINVVWGDISYGNPGVKAPLVGRTYHFPEKDFTKDQYDWGLNNLEQTPSIKVIGNNASKFHAILPMKVGKDNFTKLKIAAIDNWGNVDKYYRGTINFTSTDPDAILPQEYTFSEEDQGTHVFEEIIFGNEGLQKIQVSDEVFLGSSNYVLVEEEAPAGNIYFGDIHGHTYFSDGVNIPRENYEYAKNTAFLDFAAITDHEDGYLSFRKVFPPENWETLKQLAKEFNSFDNFVALVASEESALKYTHNGHMNVYHFDDDNSDAIIYSDEHPSTLWARLEGKVFSIPHHPTVTWAGANWEVFNSTFEPVVEIYSMHGAGEYYNNPFTPTKQVSADSKKFVQDALGYWGLKLGFIASSDAHLVPLGSLFEGPVKHNKIHNTGLAAIYSEELSRNGLYEGIKSRRTYATTGERIFINFKIEGYPMGTEFNSATVPEIEVIVAGTNELEKVEIVKYSKSKGWENILRAYPASDIYSLQYSEDNFTQDSLYYVRVTQIDGEMAWSSPSEELTYADRRGEYAFDDNPFTHWQNEWPRSNPNQEYPNWIEIDLGDVYQISGLSYLVRQDKIQDRGKIKDYNLYGSYDGVDWSLMYSGRFENVQTEQIATFIEQGARYVKFEALNDFGGESDPFTMVAEFNLFGYLSSGSYAPNGIIESPSGDITIGIGETLDFQGSMFDLNDDINLSGYWTFDGLPEFPNFTGEDPGVITFNNPGIVNVTFTVTDSEGLSDPTPDTRTITVRDGLPPSWIPHTNWVLQYVNSEELSEELTYADRRGEYAFDDNPFTHWQNEWPRSNPNQEYPNWIEIDLRDVYQISGLSYLVRQDKIQDRGRIKNYNLYGSYDGVNWNLISSGKFENVQTEQIVNFIKHEARYVKFEALSDFGGESDPFTMVAEFNLFGSK